MKGKRKDFNQVAKGIVDAAIGETPKKEFPWRPFTFIPTATKLTLKSQPESQPNT